MSLEEQRSTPLITAPTRPRFTVTSLLVASLAAVFLLVVAVMNIQPDPRLVELGEKGVPIMDDDDSKLVAADKSVGSELQNAINSVKASLKSNDNKAASNANDQFVKERAKLLAKLKKVTDQKAADTALTEKKKDEANLKALKEQFGADMKDSAKSILAKSEKDTDANVLKEKKELLHRLASVAKNSADLKGVEHSASLTEKSVKGGKAAWKALWSE
eukprot:JP436701.1.p2 GENE.JP436701.1~~JP436701.1.p2  ORF type:complete len:217 (-),score=85.46 JP436701.1:66-716(-)